MTATKCCFLIISSLLFFISNSASKESFDYHDRTCDSHDCFYGAVKSYGDCTFSQNKTSCNGLGCKFIGNSNIRLCINPSIISSQTMDELSKMILSSSVSIGSQQLCLYDDDDNVYDELCKKAGGPDSKCHPSSKKCVMTHEQYAKIDSIFEDDIKKNHKLSYELPYDYTNNILVVVDGTSTKGQFESDSYDAAKGGSYNMAENARWSDNGNWGNHPSNFYEDYRGAKYYWYGPDYSGRSVAAGSEVHGLVEGVVDVICEFIGNATMINGKYEVKDINIDLIGYSRGGYTIMEVGRKLDRDGCPLSVNKAQEKINIRFMGLYDPVSSIFECEDIFNCHAALMDGGMSDGGLYCDDEYYYDSNKMPTNVEHIAISYGDPVLGSRAYFNTCEDKKDNDKRSEEIKYEKFKTTHGGIGGTPLDGDYEQIKTYLQNDGWKGLWGLNRKIYGWIMDGVGDVSDYGVEMECTESMKSDMFIRKKANEYKLPIDATDKEYYGFPGCDGHLNE
mmetsp:Transcript_70926/g.63691  ORF Transcript_70926/g.63691 Transcript_70926/m.63691 type:complete len:505 (-) Transcript_70926:61-1575(-)